MTQGYDKTCHLAGSEPKLHSLSAVMLYRFGKHRRALIRHGSSPMEFAPGCSAVPMGFHTGSRAVGFTSSGIPASTKTAGRLSADTAISAMRQLWLRVTADAWGGRCPRRCGPHPSGLRWGQAHRPATCPPAGEECNTHLRACRCRCLHASTTQCSACKGVANAPARHAPSET
jgi:hypothetical protein